jgi:hypothetical protein
MGLTSMAMDWNIFWRNMCIFEGDVELSTWRDNRLVAELPLELMELNFNTIFSAKSFIPCNLPSGIHIVLHHVASARSSVSTAVSSINFQRNETLPQFRASCPEVTGRFNNLPIISRDDPTSPTI